MLVPETSPTGGIDDADEGEGCGMAEPATVTVRYWAGARAAAGTDAETHRGDTLGAVLDAAVAAHPELDRVVAVSTFLLDGRASDRSAPVAEGVTVEVLPPFAGG